MRLSKPAAPFERLDVRGGSITIDVDAKKIVIPTDNQYLLLGHNQWTESLDICDLVETPCGGLKNSIVQDKSPGALLIEGDGCYLQNVEGAYTGKSIGAGKLSETSSILDSGSTGIALATADGIAIKMMDGNLILLRPPSCIVEKFKVINISNIAATYAIIVQCPDFVDSIELYNIDVSRPETVSFTKVGTSYIFSNSIASNSSITLQVTIKYQSLEHTTEFTDDANTVIGLQNMSKSFIAIIPKTGKEVDVLSFTERPKSISYKQEADGAISQITIFPGNDSINHSRITHPNHSRVSGTGTIPDILNADIGGSVTKFLKSYGMKTHFASDATITTWIVPAISDAKILPKSTISDDYLGDEINLRMCPGEYGSASFVVRFDKDTKFEIAASNLVSGENAILKDNIDIKVVKCWYQGGHTLYDCKTYGRFLTPELLINDDSLLSIACDEWDYYNQSNPYGNNYIKTFDGIYINTSTGILTPSHYDNIYDADELLPINIHKNYNKQFWITIHVPTNSIIGNYTSTIKLNVNGFTLKNINIVLNVLPINLLPPTLEYSIYYSGTVFPNTTNSSAQKTIEQYRSDLENMLEHGITNPAVRWQPAETFEQVLSIRQQVGIDTTNLYYSGLNINSSVLEIQNLVSLTREFGIQNVYVYGIDETNLNTSELRAKMNSVHEAGAKIYNSQFPSFASDISDLLDLANVAFAPESEIAAKYHDPTENWDSMPHRVFSYSNPQTAVEYPHEFRLNYGLLLWQNNFDGAMDFSYQFEPNNNGNIWDDFDSLIWRDHCFTYPTANRIINTVQYEGFREAVNDMRYLSTLQAAITAAKNRGVITTNIETWLATLKTTDLTNTNLDDIRSQIIDRILELQSSLDFSAILMKNGKAILFKDNTQLFLEG